MKNKLAKIRAMCRNENEKLIRAAQNQCWQMQFGSAPNRTTESQFIQAANRAQFAEQILMELERKS